MLTFTGDKITVDKKSPLMLGVCNIMQGPDGYIYLGVGKEFKNNPKLK
jgi:hypothetical protein